MLDVAAVAGLLLTTHAPLALRRRLLALHPEGEVVSLRLLLFVIALHDLGKFTPAFQVKLESMRAPLTGAGFDLAALKSALHHGAAGTSLVRDALAGSGLARSDALALSRAVTAHHGEFPLDTQVNRPMAVAELGRSPRWAVARSSAVASLRAHFGVEVSEQVLSVDHAFVMQLAGLTAVADWIGSMDEVFTYCAPSTDPGTYWPLALERAERALDRAGIPPWSESGDRTFRELFPGLTPWPLHVAAERAAVRIEAPSLIIVEAPMGEGKTEAALLFANAAAVRAGQQGVFIGLPTKATANQMFGRVKRYLEATRPDQRSTLVLAHGDASLFESFRSIVAVYDPNDARGSGVRAEGWFLSKKRSLLAENSVGTIDQALLGVMRTGHGFVRLFGLAGKTVVLDEVHAYDTYTGTILDRLLEWLAALGTTVVLLSATLPRARREALTRSYRRGLGVSGALDSSSPYPRVTVASAAETSSEHVEPRGASRVVSLGRLDDDLEQVAKHLLRETKDGGCAAWICNTVDRAQRACEAVARLAPDVPRKLIHARMLPGERSRHEQELEHWLGNPRGARTRPHRCIVIGTQVLEQSLDVDFDLMASDLAPVDLILQRAGRLHRHDDRRDRAASQPAPRLWIVRAEGNFDRVPIRDVAMVYAEALVRETVRTLQGRTSLTLPDDIEGLVESVYHAGLPVDDDALFGAYIEHFGRSAAQRQDAGGRLIERPLHEDDIFADFKVTLDDDEDPRLHSTLRAMTRDADESLQIVCVVERAGRLFVDEVAAEPFDLGAPPDRALTKRLIGRSVGISRASLVRFLALNPFYLPSAWTENALLRHRRLVAFTDAVAIVDDTRLRLHPELGLILEPVSRRSPA